MDDRCLRACIRSLLAASSFIIVITSVAFVSIPPRKKQEILAEIGAHVAVDLTETREISEFARSMIEF